jgi:ATP-dependent DNA helicase RecG
LRGRVGRGSDPAWCLLHTETAEGSPARARLDAVASTSDGFRLARVDLEQRREGDVLGVAQSGRRSGVRLLRLLQDEELIAAAREQATALVDTDPELAAHPAMRLAIEELLEPEQAAYLEKA